MKKFLLKLMNSKVISPWWVLAIDMLIVANAFFIAFLLRLSFQLSSLYVWDMVASGGSILAIYLFTYLVTGTYKGVVRHSNYFELKVLIIACFKAFVLALFAELVFSAYEVSWWKIPRLVLFFHFLLTAMISFAFRFVVKETYYYLTKRHAIINTLIYGAGNMGQIALEAIRSDKDNDFQVVGFIDDNPIKWNVKLHSMPVISWETAKYNKLKSEIKVIILAIDNISVGRKKEIAKECVEMGWTLKVMPTVGNWVNGISNRKQIRDIRIEDILGRKEIQLDLRRISMGLENKTVLVSGAAGSIGSEIVRQLLRFPIKKIVLLDIAESALYDLQQELVLSYYDVPFELVLADFTNSYRMRQVFEEYRPNIIYNAAAYKHVPLMEANPYEAIRVNIGGTKLIADLAVEFNVEKFVMVSTDKAVNPTNVMGASKRICEIYIQSLAYRVGMPTSFITTRFGNVLGSNGSVVPLFKKQIAQGGPVTVTHPEITRFFMTIPEASQLVLEAGFMGNGGEIFVFDMGEPVKIDDLAKEMIQLAGLKLGIDIDVIYTGLRPGEKLYEELLATKENNKPTHHESIMIGQVRIYDYHDINRMVVDLLSVLGLEDDWLLVNRMKDLVPEFVSNNSTFTSLDKNKKVKDMVNSVKE